MIRREKADYDIDDNDDDVDDDDDDDDEIVFAKWLTKCVEPYF